MDSTTPFPPNSLSVGQRSLAAIVFTDVVSFSARMQADEETTLRLLKRDFDTIRDMCLQHHGSVLKTTGDGLLLYFSSAVQAVACALAMQRSFAEQLKTRPATESLTHRLGIHLGDVFVNEQDVMGDGVNIAARLQAEAEPGGICISQTVYDVVRNKLALHVTRLGPRELKNISQAIPIYKLLLEAQVLDGTVPEPEIHSDEPRTDKLKIRLPAYRPTKQHLLLLGAITFILALIAGMIFAFVMKGRLRSRNQAVTEQTAFNALIEEDPAASDSTAKPASRVLGDWRSELTNQRSRALEDYDFDGLGRTMRDPNSYDGRVRALALQRLRAMLNWLATDLQRYTRERPLVVRELTGTAPKEIRVYVGSDRQLYYIEGGAVRQRTWSDLRPTVLAAIISGALIEADPPPTRDIVQGAVAFSRLYNLPELPASLREGRIRRVKK